MRPDRCALLLSLAAGLAASAAMAGDADDRAALSRQLLERWSPHVEEVHQQESGQWSREMAPLLEAVPLADLRKAASARHFDDMNDALLGNAAQDGDGDVTQAFGDIDTDLLFVPVTPCRIIDTRIANGRISANTSRDFDVTTVANYTAQGGSATNCGVGDQGSFAAALINFTVVTPTAAGYITAYPFGAAVPVAATVNYVAGDIRGNLAAVRLDQGADAAEMSVYTFAQTHLVADIVGFFRNPSPPVFECVNTALNIVLVPPGATAGPSAPACPAGYTSSSTGCQTNSWDMPLVYADDGSCAARNNSANPQELRARRTCCRVRIP